MYLAEPLHDLAELRRGQAQFRDAEYYLSESLKAVDSQARTLGGLAESRSAFESKRKSYYQDYVDLLLILGKQQDAADALERSRAGLLLSLVAERDLSFGLDVPTALEKEQRHADAEYERVQGELHGKMDASKAEDNIERLKEARRKQEEIARRIKSASPRYASLRYPEPLGLPGTKAALDHGTLLLSYSVGREKTHLFAVEPSGVKGAGLTLYTLAFNDESLRESVEAYRNLLEFRDPGNAETQSLVARSRSLYDALVKPAEALIARYDRLLILPDGPLHTVPFAALVRGVKTRSAAVPRRVEARPYRRLGNGVCGAEEGPSREPAARRRGRRLRRPEVPEAAGEEDCRQARR